MSQCLVMLQQWLNHAGSRTDLLRDALGAIGRHDVVAQCMTGREQVPDDVTSRQQAISALALRTQFFFFFIFFFGATENAGLENNSTEHRKIHV